jgi:cytochrome P450
LTEVYGYLTLTLLNGGHTNQTTTFVWSLLHAVRSNLLSTLRSEEKPNLLQAAFREAGRLYTSLILLRKTTNSQKILERTIPAGTFVACSPVVTAQDPTLFPEPDKFLPQRWLVNGRFDEGAVKSAQRAGTSIQFGKGQHACPGEKLGKMIVIEILWGTFLNGGFDLELVSGIEDGVGYDGVGIEPAWAEENLGTPFERGGPIMVRFNKRYIGGEKIC